MNNSRIAIVSICYNEAELIGACVRSWKGLVDKHLVLVNVIPWKGIPQEYDGTVEIARKEGAEVIVNLFRSEHEQRNWGLAYLYNYDYVLIIDPDEFYTKEDQEKILQRLNDPLDYINRVMKPLTSFTAAKMITYWKTTDYVFNPTDVHKPYIAVDPKRVRFNDKRSFEMINSDYNYNNDIDVTIHHLSWVKSDKKIKEKIQSYSHAEEIPLDWYEETWLKWQPNSDMLCRPYGIEKSKAIYQPIPIELNKLIKQ